MSNSSQTPIAGLEEVEILDQISKIISLDEGEILDNVKSLIDVVEHIFNQISHVKTNMKPKPESLETKFEESLSFDIENICSQLTETVLIKKKDPHEAVVSLLESETLKTYDWDEKLVLTMTAFGLTCGRVYLTSKLYFSNHIGRSLAMLSKFSRLSQKHVSRNEILNRFENLGSLISEMMKVSRIVVMFSKIEYEYISKKHPEFSMAITSSIPVATYKIIFSAFSCLTAIANELQNKENQINFLIEILKKQRDVLQDKWNECQKITDDNKEYENFLNLLNQFDTNEGGIGPVLKALFTGDKLYYGRRGREVSIDEVRTKQIMLLISNLDIEKRELEFLQDIHKREYWYRPTQDEYEIVWIPMNVGEEDPMKKCKDLGMNWYSCLRSTSLKKPAIKMIKEVWHFRSSPMLVVFDAKGTIVCYNAIPMMFIWGNNAHPFTTIEEKKLWEKTPWKPQLLLRDYPYNIFAQSTYKNTFTFLYGGDKVDKWARELETLANKIKSEKEIHLEIVNVCRNNEVHKQDLWLFWRRIESMVYSKIMGKYKDETLFSEKNKDDILLPEIMRIVAYYKEGGWILLCNESDVFVNGQSDIVLRTLNEYDQWKEDPNGKGFGECFKQHYNKIKNDTDHLCWQLDFPDNLSSRIPRRMICPDCTGIMNRHVTLVCSHKDETIEFPF